MHAVMAVSAMASLVDVTACITDAVPVPSLMLSSIADYASILNRVAASIPAEVHAFAEIAVDRLRGLSHLNKFNAWFAHERFWAAGGVIDPHTYEQQRTSRAGFAGTPIAFLNDLSTKLDTAMRSMDAVPTPQSVEDLVRQSQQILLTIAAGTPGEDGIPIRLNPANAADWQIIRKALFLALSVTSDPINGGDTFLSTLFDCAKFYLEKTESDAIKGYYWKAQALAKNFSSIWKGLLSGQADAELNAGLTQVIAIADPLVYNAAWTSERGSSYPALKSAYEQAKTMISIAGVRGELATALSLHPKLNHLQTFKALYPDLMIWTEYHIPSQQAIDLVDTIRTTITHPVGFEPERVHLKYEAGKWSLRGIKSAALGNAEHILWRQGASAEEEFIGALEDGRGTHLFSFKVNGASAVIKAISSGYIVNLGGNNASIGVAHGAELGIVESSAYPVQLIDDPSDDKENAVLTIKGAAYSGERGVLMARRGSVWNSASSTNLSYTIAPEIKQHNGKNYNFFAQKGHGIMAHKDIVLEGQKINASRGILNAGSRKKHTF